MNKLPTKLSKDQIESSLLVKQAFFELYDVATKVILPSDEEITDHIKEEDEDFESYCNVDGCYTR
jgi:hypothetical protein